MQSVERLRLIFRKTCFSPVKIKLNRAILKYAQARKIFPLKSKMTFWDHLTFRNKHLIFIRSLKEPLGGNSVKSSDRRAFSLFKTVPGCQAFSHSVIGNFPRRHNYFPKVILTCCSWWCDFS